MIIMPVYDNLKIESRHGAHWRHADSERAPWNAVCTGARLSAYAQQVFFRLVFPRLETCRLPSSVFLNTVIYFILKIQSERGPPCSYTAEIFPDTVSNWDKQEHSFHMECLGRLRTFSLSMWGFLSYYLDYPPTPQRNKCQFSACYSPSCYVTENDVTCRGVMEVRQFSPIVKRDPAFL